MYEALSKIGHWQTDPKVAGLAYLAHFGAIEVVGNDALTFLQGQLSCDLTKLHADEYMLGAFCNPKGRIITLQFVQATDNGFHLLMTRDCISIFIESITKYAVFSKVEIRDISDDWHLLAALDNERKLPSFYKIAKNETLSDHVQALCSQYRLLTNEAWRAKAICAGLPVIYAQTSLLFTPHDIDVPEWGGVSFEKGCYVGQEIVARMHHLGKRKKHLHYQTCATAARYQLGDKIYDANDKLLGTVLDSVMDAGKQYVLASLNTALTSETQWVACAEIK